ncbi:CPBP family intramembrane glutamic endopeptidase [Patescibacteria group bacterium]
MFQKVRQLTSQTEPYWSIIFVPIWQELLFRYVPYFIYLKLNNFWLIGIISSLVFTSIHWYFKKWFIVFSFFGGILLWIIIVKFGLLPTIIIHSTINLLLNASGLRKRAEKKFST